MKDTIPYERFGKDHWSTFLYVEHCAVNRGGLLDPRKLRKDGERYPTRLRDGSEVKGHADHDCIRDLRAAGLLDGDTPTEKGWELAGRLRQFVAAGGQLTDFGG